jgi:Subtilase family
MIRIVWRFHPQRSLPDLASPGAPAFKLLNLPSFFDISPVFPGNRFALQDKIDSLPTSFKKIPLNDPVRYYQTFVPEADAIRPVVERLLLARSQGLIEWFDIQDRIGPPVSPPPDSTGNCLADGDGSFESCQEYLAVPSGLAGARQGVGARFAWSREGGRGQAVRVVDIDTGWNLQHEEFRGRPVTQLGGIVDDFHGTAVLGILWGKADTVGVTGIVHEADMGLALYKASPSGEEPNPEAQVLSALDFLDEGDVILFEVGARRIGPDGQLSPELPMEAFEHGRSAINLAHAANVYVVEPAANGGIPLTPALGVPLSGPALMVGAGNPITGAVRPISNRGSRLDLQGWGRDVVTTGSEGNGFCELRDGTGPDACYTAKLNATSSASAIVAGCVAAISSIVKAHGRSPLSTTEMKRFLRETGTFRSAADVQGGLIGPLPNLQAALAAIETHFREEDGFPGFRPAAS